MPLYEYECRQCGHRFEALVTGARTPECPKCKSADLEKQLSPFGVGSASGSSPAGGGCGSSAGGG